MTTPASPSAPEAEPSTPPTSTDVEPAFGWTRYAEVINGRFAMLGFILVLLIELITHQDFITWLGFR
ncbi:MAG: chlorophyll a/b-binding protein [Cyanobacteria bacterium J06638_22]